MRGWAFWLAMLLAGLSAHGAAASPQGKRVALLATLNTNPYIGAWTSTFIKDATADGMKVQNFSTPYDAAIQSQQVDDAIAQKFDIILIVYVNAQAIVPALVRAKQAHIPVILFTTPLEKEHDDLFMSFIGSDQEELGRIAAQDLVQGLAAEGKSTTNVVAITGVLAQYHVRQRMDGFRAVLDKHPGIKLAAVEDGKWNTAVSENVAGQLFVRLSGSGGVDGVLAMADNQATGVIAAAQSAGVKLGVKDKGLVIVGTSCMKEGIAHIRDGEQYSTAALLPTVEAATAAQKTAAYFNGEKLKKYELIPSAGITRANLDRYAAACSY